MAPFLDLATAGGFRKADLLRLGPLEGELGRVLEYQDWAVCRLKPQRRSREMARQVLVFADICVREEPIGRFRVRPVLNGCRKGFPRRFSQCRQHNPPAAGLGKRRFHSIEFTVAAGGSTVLTERNELAGESLTRSFRGDETLGVAQCIQRPLGLTAWKG